MVECPDAYLEKFYIANNNLEWKPGESTSFVAYPNVGSVGLYCDLTVFWRLNGQTVTAKSKTNITGTLSEEDELTRFMSTLDHSEIIDDVGPGVYNMKVLLYSNDLIDDEWWTYDDGSKIEIVVYKENGDPPDELSNIIVNDITFEEDKLLPGQTGTAIVEFENTGSASGEKSFDVSVAEKGGSYETVDTVNVELGSGKTAKMNVEFTAGDASRMTVKVGGQYGTIDVTQDPIQNESLTLSGSTGGIEARYSYTNTASSEVTFNVEVVVTNTDTGNGVHSTKHEIVASPDSDGGKTFDIGVDVPTGQTTDFEVCVKEI